MEVGVHGLSIIVRFVSCLDGLKPLLLGCCKLRFMSSLIGLESRWWVRVRSVVVIFLLDVFSGLLVYSGCVRPMFEPVPMCPHIP